MEEKLKYIATDSKSFRELIEGGYLYIDKTEYLYKMLRKGSPSKYWFLSRPRRFGKSLLIDTLENIFKGNRELFKGTYIYDSYDFEEHPVIRLNMINVNKHDEKTVSLQMMKQIENIGKALNVYDEMDLSVPTSSDYLSSLIRAVCGRYGKKVVVLVDEYDYPLMENIHGDALDEIRDELATFYNIFKAEEENICFCFLTGVTRFQHVSIFSKLNNLTDISTDPEYAAICGYTDSEIDHYFAPYMEKYFSENNIADDGEKKAFRTRIKEFYDGYRFSFDNPVTMYNPVSIGRFFIGGCRFRNYWIETGMQSLVNEIVERNASLFRKDDEFSVPISKANRFEMRKVFSEMPDRGYVLSYLMQAGYLTIVGSEAGDYILSYPNEEVRDAMDAAVLTTYGVEFESERVAALRKALLNEDTAGIIKVLYNSFTSYPYQLTLDREKGFQIAVFSALGMCAQAVAEDVTNVGRIDITVNVKSGVYYIIELKLDKSADEALSQIKEKKYYEKYAKEGNKIHLLGINFSSKGRNITGWKEEVLTL